MCWPSAMKRARFSRSVGSVSRPTERREPMCVRSGPMRQPPRAADGMTGAAAGGKKQSPAPLADRAAGGRLCALQARPSNSAAGMAMTSSAISACGPPQYSAHWPRKTPGRSALTAAAWCGRGSCRPCRRDRHPEAMDDVGRRSVESTWRGRPGCGSRWRSGPASVCAGIGDTPPPLLAGHLDALCFAGPPCSPLRVNHRP